MLALVLGARTAAEAQQPALSLADLGMSLKSGETVFVTDGSGRETRGRFATVSDSGLTLSVDGQFFDIASKDIREVARRGDSMKNGFLIGAGVGAGLSAVVAAAYQTPAYLAIGAPINAAFWGGFGVLVDYLIKGRTVVFRAPGTALRLRPGMSVGPRRASASVTVSAR